MAEITPEDYFCISHLVRGQSGLDLGEGKEYLVTSRLEPILPSLGFKSMPELFSALRKPAPCAKLVRTVSEAMATHESLFFRDRVPFDCLVKNMVPALVSGRNAGEKIRIWSAACSFGQEPLSILFSLDENPACLAGREVELIATDFSSHAITRARSGIYSAFELQRGLTPDQVKNFFEPSGTDWKVQERFRRRVDFREMNFLDSFLPLGTVDIIFCRNVLIYFDLPMKKEILERMGRALVPDGYLVLGSTESLLGVTDVFLRREDFGCAVFSLSNPGISGASKKIG